MNIIIHTDSASPLLDLDWLLSALRERHIPTAFDRYGNLIATVTATATPDGQARRPGRRIAAARRAGERTWPPSHAAAPETEER
jgi:hypothetical protein